ncbi:MAG: LLM class flavin-dependent oxidoreductase [Solirubrobacteraceae bacterium]|nr:LLM class flavin-dependent oxidoreductase [Solirubrobacteraceae bacterium]
MSDRDFQVGVYVDAHPAIAEQARAIERAGFDHVWVYDSPLVFSDPYMALLDVARATDRVLIGPGVTQPHARPAHATAQALGTLAKVAPGRVAFGIGIGNSASWSVGQRPATLDEMHEHIRIVQGMLRGETVDHDVGGGRRAPLRFIHPDGRWIDLSRPVPTWVSAFGPVGQRRAGANADVVLIRWEGAERVAEAKARLAEGARAAGRPGGGADIGIGTVYCVYPIDDEAELETAEARAALGPMVVSRLRYLTANHEHADEVPEHFRPGFVAYQEHRASLDPVERHLDNYRGYLVHTPPDLESFVTPETMRTVATIGSPDEIVAELLEMRDAGVDHVTLQLAGPPAGWCARMGERVLPRLR